MTDKQLTQYSSGGEEEGDTNESNDDTNVDEAAEADKENDDEKQDAF